MGAKKDKVIDLKPKATNITEEQLGRLQQVVNNINGIQFEVGKIEAQKHSYLHRLAGVQDEIAILQDELNKEYGTFDVDLKDGTINYPEDGEPRN
jgi:conjugal transfer/entry exclusion protein